MPLVINSASFGSRMLYKIYHEEIINTIQVQSNFRGDGQLCSSARSLDDESHLQQGCRVKTPLTSSKLGTLGSPGGHMSFEIWGKYYFFITLGFHNTNDNQLAWLT